MKREHPLWGKAVMAEAEVRTLLRAPRGPGANLPGAPYSAKLDQVYKFPSGKVQTSDSHVVKFLLPEASRWNLDDKKLLFGLSLKTESSQNRMYHLDHMTSMDTIGGIIAMNSSRADREGTAGWAYAGTLVECFYKSKPKDGRPRITYIWVPNPPRWVYETFAFERQKQRWLDMPAEIAVRTRACVDKFGNRCPYPTICLENEPGSVEYIEAMKHFKQVDIKEVLGASTEWGASRYSAMAICPMKHQLKYVDQLQPVVTESKPALDIGSAYHLIREVNANGKVSEENLEHWASLPRAAREKGKELMDAYAREVGMEDWMLVMSEEDELKLPDPEENFEFNGEVTE